MAHIGKDGEILNPCHDFKIVITLLCPDTVLCEAQGRGFFRRADSFFYISRYGMTSLDLCLQLIPPGQGNQPRRRQLALAGLASTRHLWREAGGH